MLNLLGGLENPTHGCVYINDVDITQLSMEERSSFRRWHIGFIFQNFNLIPEMNVFENIVLPAKLMERNISKKEVMRIAEELESEEKLLQNPMTLSGGQQQRVAIARAIYTHPTILLGDELTGNLDSTTSISVMKFLKKMCKKYSQTMIIVTHDEGWRDGRSDYSDERWGAIRMENYDCNQSAERVLMDASRKKNQNRNRLLFIVITITVGVIFSVFSLIYGKMEIDIRKI